MDSSKHGSSETSSNENDQPEKVNYDNAGTGRSYECTFCKRGFTNAQALGGHMNIHRKDKAKAKNITEASMSNKADSTASKYFAPVSNEQAHYYAALGAQMNYQMYFPASNPSFPYAYHSSHLTTDSEYLGANLSLQIAPPLVEDSEEEKKDGRRKTKGNEVDLELRLGHNP